MSNVRSEIENYCAAIGKDRSLVQGAGGNVSWKEGGRMYVKASGTWLSDANKKDIFLPVELSVLYANIENNIFSIPEGLSKKGGMKPSIETMLHAIMQHTIVVHLHAIDILSILVREDAERTVSKTLKDKMNYIFIDYIKPGPDLARSIYKEILQNNSDVIFLKNHGVVVGGSSIQEVQEEIEFILALFRSNSYIKRPELNGSYRGLKIEGYNMLSIPETKWLACNYKIFDNLSNNWALYPDHVVFLGGAPNLAIDIDSAKKIITSRAPSYVIVRGYGIFVSPDISKSETSQLICYSDVLARQSKDQELHSLTKEEVGGLLSWESEKFRVRQSV